MADVRDWSQTAASNTDYFPEGMAPSAVNDGGRAVQAALARVMADEGGTLTTAGTATAYTLTINTAPTALSDGLYFSFTAHTTNTGAASLTVTPSGSTPFTAKNFRYFANGTDADIPAGAIVSGGHYLVQYDSAAASGAGAFILLNPTISSEVFLATGTATNAASVAISIPSGYAAIEVLITDLALDTASTFFGMQVSTDGTTYNSGATDYRYAIDGLTDAGAVISAFSTGNSIMAITGTATASASGAGHARVRIPNPGGSAYRKLVHIDAAYLNGAGNYAELSGMGVYNTASTGIQAVRFLPSGGLVSLSYVVKGYRR